MHSTHVNPTMCNGSQCSLKLVQMVRLRYAFLRSRLYKCADSYRFVNLMLLICDVFQLVLICLRFFYVSEPQVCSCRKVSSSVCLFVCPGIQRPNL
jgi:hypothetical protein